MKWYLEVWKKFSVFHGRSRRSEYWWFALVNVIVFVPLILVDAMTGTLSEDSGLGLLSTVYCFAVFIPSIAVSIRRLHDIGRSGWWFLLTFVPLLGLVVLVFAARDSEPGDNQFGPNPKGVVGGATPAPVASR